MGEREKELQAESSEGGSSSKSASLLLCSICTRIIKGNKQWVSELERERPWQNEKFIEWDLRFLFETCDIA